MKKVNSALRISIIDNCNFACLYCPRNDSMENYCPEELKSKKLTTEDMKKALSMLLEKYEFSKIVITGGEPLLCNDIASILKFIKRYNNDVELDTNGSLYNKEKWNEIKPYINGVKISLDSLNEHTFNYLTKYGNRKSLENIISLINSAKKDNIPVTINCVCTKSNFNEISGLIDFCVRKEINVSILDLYYTKETENFWKENYVNIDALINKVSKQYGQVEIDDSFGCDFKKIYFNKKNYIKFKSSSSVTMRDDICKNCESYCQEGIFCLRFSRQGWMTTCQSNEENGALFNDLEGVKVLINRLENAKPDQKSFEKMLKKNRVFVK